MEQQAEKALVDVVLDPKRAQRQWTDAERAEWYALMEQNDTRLRGLGLDGLTLEEINAEIGAAREEMRAEKLAASKRSA